METDDPAATFAPIVLLDRAEPWQPMGVDEFLRYATLWWSDRPRCGVRKVAVGRALGDQRGGSINWIFPQALGPKTAYYRNPLIASDCQYDFDRRFYATQLTRPHQQTGRASRASLENGFYLDLEDRARAGSGRRVAYYDAQPTSVDGDSGVRVTYWMLFGAERVAGRVREGDWERVEVELRRDGDAYEPRALRVHLGERTRSIDWDDVERSGTHPVLAATPESHELTAGACPDCERWRLSAELVNARRELWYGFGGAWGDMGEDSATTGSIGPNDGTWPTRAEVERSFGF